MRAELPLGVARSEAYAAVVGLRDRIFKLLDRGDRPEVDPDEMVELISVPLPRGPMLLAQLEAEGFDVHGVDAYDVPTRGLNRYLITVRQRDFAAASGFLDNNQL